MIYYFLVAIKKFHVRVQQYLVLYPTHKNIDPYQHGCQLRYSRL